MTSRGTTLLVKNPIMKLLLLIIGWICLSLGVIGIFLPVLPTVPFLLLSAFCFVRSSPSAYIWLIEHPRWGRYLLYYIEGEGIPLKAKVYSLTALWLSIGLTSYFIIPLMVGKIALIVIALFVSLYISTRPNLEMKEID